MGHIEEQPRPWLKDMKWLWETDLSRFRDVYEVTVKGHNGRKCKYTITTWVPNLKLVGHINNKTGEVGFDCKYNPYIGYNPLYRHYITSPDDPLPRNNEEAEELKEQFLNYIEKKPKKGILSFLKKLISGK